MEDLTAQIPAFTVICQDRISFTSATEKFFKSPKLNCSGLKAVIFISADKHGTLSVSSRPGYISEKSYQHGLELSVIFFKKIK